MAFGTITNGSGRAFSLGLLESVITFTFSAKVVMPSRTFVTSIAPSLGAGQVPSASNVGCLRGVPPVSRDVTSV